MSRLGVSIEKINSAILKFFAKHQGGFNNICESKQQLFGILNYKCIFFLHILNI